jgi:hypothetical protein
VGFVCIWCWKRRAFLLVTLVGSCGGQIVLRTSSDVFIFNLGLHSEGLFWERNTLNGQIAFEGH